MHPHTKYAKMRNEIILMIILFSPYDAFLFSCWVLWCNNNMSNVIYRVPICKSPSLKYLYVIIQKVRVSEKIAYNILSHSRARSFFRTLDVSIGSTLKYYF